MGTYSAGLDLSAIVCDIGSHSSKIGFAGKDAPDAFLPTLAGLCLDEGASQSYGRTGSQRRYVFDIQAPSSPVSLKSPLVDGLVEDWEIVESLLQYSLTERLGCAEGSMAGHPFLLSEHLYASKADREIWCELLFERFGCAGTFMSRAGILALYSNARTTGISIDMGAGGTQITPVQEGYALMSGARLHPVGGALLDAYTSEQVLARAGVRIDPRLPQPPSARIVSSAPASGGDDLMAGAAAAPPRQPATSAATGHHPSLRAWAAGCAVSDLKRALFRVADEPLDGGGLGETAAPAVPYELPDGTVISVGVERLAVPELIFNPAPLRSLSSSLQLWVPGSCSPAPPYASMSSSGTVQLQQLPYAGVPTLQDSIAAAVAACDGDLRNDLVASLVLTGGASGLPGLPERLYREYAPIKPLTEAGAPSRPKIVSASREERAIGVWLGGSILGSLSSFPELWFSKAEYAEHGAKMVHKKCP